MQRRGLYGSISGSAGPVRAWCVPDAASGRLPPTAVEVVPSRVLLYYHSSPESPRLGLPASQRRLGETAAVIAKPWWRVLAGGKLDGVLRNIRGSSFLGVGRNPCHLDTDAVTPVGVASLPEGRLMYPFSSPVAYRGKP